MFLVRFALAGPAVLGAWVALAATAGHSEDSARPQMKSTKRTAAARKSTDAPRELEFLTDAELNTPATQEKSSGDVLTNVYPVDPDVRGSDEKGGSAAWVVGPVAHPGPYQLISPPVTLGRLLYRAGGVRESETDGEVVVLRGEAHSMEGKRYFERSAGSLVTRCNVITNPRESLQISVMEGDFVIVKPRQERAIYVSVMPHFVARLEPSSGNSFTLDRVAGVLEETWPRLRDRSCRVYRADDLQESASQGWGDARGEVLRSGDILCWDGSDLVADGAATAFDALLQLEGLPAPIRTHARMRRKPPEIVQTSLAEMPEERFARQAEPPPPPPAPSTTQWRSARKNHR